MNILSLKADISIKTDDNVTGTLGKVSDRVASIGSQIEKLKVQRQKSLENLDRELVWNGDSVKRLSTELEKVDKKLQKLSERKVRVEILEIKHEKNKAALKENKEHLGVIGSTIQLLDKPLTAAMRQEDLFKQIDLIFIGDGPKAAAHAAASKQQVQELTQKGLGSPEENIKAIDILKKAGLSGEMIQAGALHGTAQLSTLAGEKSSVTASVMEYFHRNLNLGLGDHLPMADMLQRGMHGLGLQLEDLKRIPTLGAPIFEKLAISKPADTSGLIGWYGAAKTSGAEMSVFHASFESMIRALPTDAKAMQEQVSKLSPDEKKIYDQSGWDNSLFDKDGKFGGLKVVTPFIESLRALESRNGKAETEKLLASLFGQKQSADILSISRSKIDPKSAEQAIRAQPGSDERLSKMHDTTSKRLEALGAAFDRFSSAVVTPAMQAMNPLIDRLTDTLNAMSRFAEAHPNLMKWIGLSFVGVGAAAGAILTLRTSLALFRLASSGLSLRIPVLSTRPGGKVPGGRTGPLRNLAGRGMRMVRNIGLRLAPVGKLGSGMGGILIRALRSGLGMAGRALLVVGRFLLLNPVGLLITAIGTAAYLIYRYWDPICAWFSNLWTRIKSACSDALDWFRSLPDSFGKIGEDLIHGLIDGIQNRLSAAREGIINFGRSIKNWFAETLGIHSPSRVFVSMGQHIGEGAQIGIRGSTPGVRSAVDQLSGVALAGAAGTQALAGVREASQALRRNPSAQHGSTAPGGAGAVNIHFAPTLNLNAAGEARSQINQAMQVSLRELEQMLRRLQAEHTRRAF